MNRDELARTCQAVGCQHSVPADHLMCGEHWRMVPAPLRRELLARRRALRGVSGREVATMAMYLSSRQTAIDTVQAKQNARVARGEAQNSTLF